MNIVPARYLILAAFIAAGGFATVFTMGRQSTKIVPVATPLAAPNPLYANDAQTAARQFQVYVDNAKTQKEIDSIWAQWDLAMGMGAQQNPDRIATATYYIKPVRDKSDAKRATLPSG